MTVLFSMPCSPSSNSDGRYEPVSLHNISIDNMHAKSSLLQRVLCSNRQPYSYWMSRIMLQDSIFCSVQSRPLPTGDPPEFLRILGLWKHWCQHQRGIAYLQFQCNPSRSWWLPWTIPWLLVPRIPSICPAKHLPTHWKIYATEETKSNIKIGCSWEKNIQWSHNR